MRDGTVAVRGAVATLLDAAGCVDALVNISETVTIGALEELSEEQTNRHFADRFFDVLRLANGSNPGCLMQRLLLSRESGVSAEVADAETNFYRVKVAL